MLEPFHLADESANFLDQNMSLKAPFTTIQIGIILHAGGRHPKTVFPICRKHLSHWTLHGNAFFSQGVQYQPPIAAYLAAFAAPQQIPKHAFGTLAFS